LEAWAPESPPAQVLGDRLWAVALDRLGRRGESGIVAEEFDHAIQIAALERVDEAVDHWPRVVRSAGSPSRAFDPVEIRRGRG